MSRTAELVDDSFPHGSVEGYHRGCKGSMCPSEISCARVFTRYSGDWTFKQRVDAGMSIAELVAADAIDADAAAVAELAQRRADREAARAERVGPRSEPKRVRRPRVPGEVRARVLAPHGTPASFRRGCKSESECPASPTCREAYRAEQRELYRRRHPDAVPRPGRYMRDAVVAEEVVEHGTEQGYWKLDCYRDDQCPAQPTCAQVHLGELPRAVLDRRASEPRELQPHGTNAGYARGCKTHEECPNVLTGGVSCSDAHKAYHRAYTLRRRAAGADGYHGTSYGYQLGCSNRDACPGGADGVKCRDAASAEEAARARARGVPARDLVDADPVRAHIAVLRQTLTYVEIGRRSGVAGKDVRRLVMGRDDPQRRGQIPAHTDRAKAEAILAVQP